MRRGVSPFPGHARCGVQGLSGPWCLLARASKDQGELIRTGSLFINSYPWAGLFHANSGS